MHKQSTSPTRLGTIDDTRTLYSTTTSSSGSGAYVVCCQQFFPEQQPTGGGGSGRGPRSSGGGGGGHSIGFDDRWLYRDRWRSCWCSSILGLPYLLTRKASFVIWLKKYEAIPSATPATTIIQGCGRQQHTSGSARQLQADCW